MTIPNNWEQLLASWEPKLQSAFLEAIYNLRNAAQVDQIIARLTAGDIDGAIRAVGIDPAQFRVFDKALESAYEAGGTATARAIPAIVDAAGFRTVVQFAIRNPQAEQWLRDYSSTLIKEIVDDQRTMVRNFLTDGLSKGLNPRTTALDLVGRLANGKREGGVIGLTSSQEEWLKNYAAELASDTPGVSLTRMLRDKRFDKTVMKAVKNGESIPADLQAKMVRNYKNRALQYRAETIARTETITSLHAAQEQAMNQAIQSGAIGATQVSFVWRTAHDSRVRDSHQVMDGQVRPRGQDFITGSGAHLRYPGDPTGPAAETINCRCYREPKVDFLQGIR